MKEESLLGKLGTRSSARYREFERLGEAFRGEKADCVSFFINFFLPRAAVAAGCCALSSPKAELCWALLTRGDIPKSHPQSLELFCP